MLRLTAQPISKPLRAALTRVKAFNGGAFRAAANRAPRVSGRLLGQDGDVVCGMCGIRNEKGARKTRFLSFRSIDWLSWGPRRCYGTECENWGPKSGGTPGIGAVVVWDPFQVLRARSVAVRPGNSALFLFFNPIAAELGRYSAGSSGPRWPFL